MAQLYTCIKCEVVPQKLSGPLPTYWRQCWREVLRVRAGTDLTCDPHRHITDTPCSRGPGSLGRQEMRPGKVQRKPELCL